MKTTVCSFMLCLLWASIYAQEITVSFQPKSSETTIDSVIVNNQRTNEKVKLLVNESLTLTKVTGISSLTVHSEIGMLYPNPCYGDAEVNITTSLNQQVEVRIYDISGQLLIAESQFLLSGQHRFNVSFPLSGMYNVSILKGNGSMSFIAVCLVPGVNECGIEYCGSEFINQSKSGIAGKTLSYAQGDILLHSAFSGKNNTIITDSPTVTKIYSVEFYECKDQDNNSYPIVNIGTQWWMAKNLKTTKLADGTSIPLITDNTAWRNLTTPGYCLYNNDTAYKNIYGALYNWYTVNSGKLCPAGWHVPSDDEWTTLITFLGGEFIAGGKMKETGTTHWLSPNTGANNESGFSALPGGYRSNSGYFLPIGDFGGWWSSTEYFTGYARYRGVINSYTCEARGYYSMLFGFSVRCLRDL